MKWQNSAPFPASAVAVFALLFSIAPALAQTPQPSKEHIFMGGRLVASHHCLLGAATAISPIGATPNGNVTFNWSAVTGNQLYALLLTTTADSLFTYSAAMEKTLTANTSLAKTLANGDYIWAVGSGAAGCDAGVSAPQFFTIPGGCPQVPTLISPDAGAAVPNPRPSAGRTFTWQADSAATMYLFSMAVLDSGGSPVNVHQKLVQTNSYTVTTPLPAGQVYWAVAAWNSTCGWTDASPARTLTVSDAVFATVSWGTSGHACALTFNGKAYCWGDNSNGQWGNGTVGGQTSIPVAVTMPVGKVFSSINAGHNHTCAVATDGAGYCWGWNNNGQLGDGTSGAGNDRSIPTAVVGGQAFSRIGAGQTHSCGVTTDGNAYCWGSDLHEALGNGPPPAGNSSIPFAVVGGKKFLGADSGSGSNHSCGLSIDGKSYCWGYNFNGTIGDGTNDTRNEPTQVLGYIFSTGAVGGTHNCGVSISGDGYCWGSNESGKLGINSGVEKLNVPTRVQMPASTTFKSISASSNHSCALATDGKAYCWGSNGSFRLGVDTPGLVLSPYPIPVNTSLKFRSISAGAVNTCGISENYDLHCWGFKGHIPVDPPLSADSATPVLVNVP